MSTLLPDFTPVGFEAMDAEWWPMIANEIPRPWPQEAVYFDLRWWAGQARATAKAKRSARRPTRPALEQRWGWSEWRVRAVMREEHKWRDAWTSDGPPDDLTVSSRQPPGDEQANADNPHVSSDEPHGNLTATSPRARTRNSARGHRSPFTDPEIPPQAPPEGGGPDHRHEQRRHLDRPAAVPDRRTGDERREDPPPPPLVLPDGREVPPDLPGLLFGVCAGRVDGITALLHAGIGDTRALLELTRHELWHTPRLGPPILRAVERHLRDVHRVELGCMAPPPEEGRAGPGPPSPPRASTRAGRSSFARHRRDEPDPEPPPPPPTPS